MTDRFTRLQQGDRVIFMGQWEGVVTEVLQVMDAVTITVAKDEGGTWRGEPGYLQRDGYRPRAA